MSKEQSVPYREKPTGYFIMPRKWMEHPLLRLKPKEKFPKALMWCWVIENACWGPAIIVAESGDIIRLGRGQLSFSIRFLAQKWCVDKGIVERTLKQWVEIGWIKTHIEAGQTVITICNYDIEQSPLKRNKARNEKSIGQQQGAGETKKNTNLIQNNSKELAGAPFGQPEEVYSVLRGFFDQTVISRWLSGEKCQFDLAENKIYATGQWLRQEIEQRYGDKLDKAFERKMQILYRQASEGTVS